MTLGIHLDVSTYCTGKFILKLEKPTRRSHGLLNGDAPVTVAMTENRERADFSSILIVCDFCIVGFFVFLEGVVFSSSRCLGYLIFAFTGTLLYLTICNKSSTTVKSNLTLKI